MNQRKTRCKQMKEEAEKMMRLREEQVKEMRQGTSCTCRIACP
jgi:hypothetical protein